MIDEEIRKQREEMEEFERQRFSKETEEEENRQSIFDGEVLIHKIPVTFAERPLFSDKVSIWMPEDFEAYTPEMIAAIYLLGNKPDLVFGNSYLPFSVGFRYTEHEVPDAMMGDFPKIVRLVLERTGPKVRILSEKVRKTEKHTISSLELISHTIEDTVYNVQFFCSLDERVLMGFVNFSFRYLDRYKPIAQEILQSFRFLDEEAPGPDGIGQSGEKADGQAAENLRHTEETAGCAKESTGAADGMEERAPGRGEG